MKFHYSYFALLPNGHTVPAGDDWWPTPDTYKPGDTTQEHHGWLWNLGHALGVVQTQAEEKAEAAAYQQAKTNWESKHPGQSYALHTLNLSLQLTPMAGVAIEGEGAELLGEAAANANKLNHIFGKAAHGLDALVSEFGSQEAAYNAFDKRRQQFASRG